MKKLTKVHCLWLIGMLIEALEDAIDAHGPRKPLATQGREELALSNADILLCGIYEDLKSHGVDAKALKESRNIDFHGKTTKQFLTLCGKGKDG